MKRQIKIILNLLINFMFVTPPLYNVFYLIYLITGIFTDAFGLWLNPAPYFSSSIQSGDINPKTTGNLTAITMRSV